jgi:hypothetical protein
MAVAEVVEDRDIEPRLQKFYAGMRSDIAGPACDEYHAAPPQNPTRRVLLAPEYQITREGQENGTIYGRKLCVANRGWTVW